MLSEEIIEEFRNPNQENYIVEYIHSSCILSKDKAMDLYKHANMKVCDNVRLYKLEGTQPVLIKEKF